MLFRTKKSWQSKDLVIILQIQTSHSELEIKNFYVFIDLKQNSCGISLKKDKDAEIYEMGTVSALLRKYISNTKLEHIYLNELEKDYWLVFSCATQQTFYLHLETTRPPNLSLIDKENKIIHFRYGQKGCFTKKKALDFIFSDFTQKHFTDILPKIFATFSASPAQKKDRSAVTQLEENTENTSHSSGQGQLRKQMRRRYKTLNIALKKMQATAATTPEPEELELKARMLQNFFYLLKNGDFELVLDPARSGLSKTLRIELDPQKTPGQNLEELFKRCKKAGKQKAILANKIRECEIQLQDIANTLLTLEEKNLNSFELENIQQKFQQKSTKNKSNNKERNFYKQFRGENEELFWVGKSSSDNDSLTKRARANDYWFHAAGSTGSHVILPFKSLKKGDLSLANKRIGGILALHYSKLKNNFAGEVYFTQRRFLKKDRGLAVGQWTILQSETLYIRYSQEDLSVILNHMDF